ncbi:hypothetical protein KQX54_015023 [Cotesia glomerata]|uniref:Uncharacterized protein n=1 Tax=Cotesia glomerata TaxID=32391 RepID=A0AAV7IZA7_COTGL|nr:hypothetical protein KQX54_015023 [Cotesia glomerata]
MSRRKEVSNEGKIILKQLAQDNQIIDGFLFHIKKYIYSQGEPVVVVECDHRCHYNKEPSFLPCNISTMIHLNGIIDPIIEDHNHIKNKTLAVERSFHKELQVAAKNTGVSLRNIFSILR